MHPSRSIAILLLSLVGLLSACALLEEPEAPSGPITAAPLSDTGSAVYRIVPDESEARFALDEHLRSARTGWALGADITVIGTTDQIAGELALDPADLSTAQIGEIRVNARALETDEFYRNRAIRNQILNTDAYEFITFAPTEVAGLPATATLGDPVTFTVDGDLTIQDTTLPQTFAVTATLVTENEVHGTAQTVVTHESYGLTIPKVANVSFVADEVTLTFDFVARTP